MKLEKPLTCRECAHLFGIHPRTLKRWLKDKKLHPPRTRGGHIRIDQKTLDVLYRDFQSLN